MRYHGTNKRGHWTSVPAARDTWCLARPYFERILQTSHVESFLLYDGIEQFASNNMICGSVCESVDTRPKSKFTA